MQGGQFSQQQKIDTFHRPTVVNAQCFKGGKSYPQTAINCFYAIKKNSLAKAKLVSRIRNVA